MPHGPPCSCFSILSLCVECTFVSVPQSPLFTTKESFTVTFLQKENEELKPEEGNLNSFHNSSQWLLGHKKYLVYFSFIHPRCDPSFFCVIDTKAAASSGFSLTVRSPQPSCSWDFLCFPWASSLKQQNRLVQGFAVLAHKSTVQQSHRRAPLKVTMGRQRREQKVGWRGWIWAEVWNWFNLQSAELSGL